MAQHYLYLYKYQSPRNCFPAYAPRRKNILLELSEGMPTARFLPRLWIFSALAKYTWQFYYRQFFFGGAARIPMWIQLMQTLWFDRILGKLKNVKIHEPYIIEIIVEQLLLRCSVFLIAFLKITGVSNASNKRKSRILAKYLSTENDLQEILKWSSSNFRVTV